MSIRGVFLLVMAITLPACSEQPARMVSAVVVSTGEHSNPKWDADQVVVTARSEGGVVGSKPVLRTRLDCRIGDTIQATIRGVALTLNARACER